MIRRIVRGKQDDLFRVRQNSLTPWLPRLEQNWAAGCRNATDLWRRRRADRFGGSLRVVGEWATRQRHAESAMLTGNGKCPPARRIAQLMISARNHLSKADAIFVTRVKAALPSLAVTRTLVDRFTDMVRNGTDADLGAWLQDVMMSDITAFARGLSSDQRAVAAAMTEPWSNSQTEG